VAIRNQLEADCNQQKQRKVENNKEETVAQNLNFQRTNMLTGAVSICIAAQSIVQG